MMKLFAFLFFTVSAYSATCEQYKKTVDKNISPSPDQACKSFEYYYKLNGKKGDEEALKCAYRELEKGDEEVFGGSSILMMIYANGRGTQKNIDLALKYACVFGGAAAEVEGRVKHLESLRSAVDDFDVCADVTSGFMEGHCARLASFFDKEIRERVLQKIQSTFGVDSQEAFKKLKSAFVNFSKTRVNNEVDLTGTARAKLMIEEEEKLEKEFVSKLERFEKNGPANHHEENDKYLNSTFQFLMTKEPIGTIRPEGIRMTQKEWLTFREAWLDFAKVRYPKVQREALMRELTDDRIKQLEEVRSYYQ